MAKETTLAEVGEMLTHVVKHMATKDDLAGFKRELNTDLTQLEDKLDEGFASLRSELRNLRADLKELRKDVENMAGFRKEIDHALGRIAAIERHLGINKKIAA